MSKKSVGIIACFIAAISSVPARTETGPNPAIVKTIAAWGVYSLTSSGDRRCYILTTPTRSLPMKVDHGSNYFLVAPNPTGNGFYPQAAMGYELRSRSPLSVSIDGKVFPMMAKDNFGWTQKASDDYALVEAMKAGSTMTLSAISKRGTETTYTFSLSGITAALTEAARCK